MDLELSKRKSLRIICNELKRINGESRKGLECKTIERMHEGDKGKCEQIDEHIVHGRCGRGI